MEEKGVPKPQPDPVPAGEVVSFKLMTFISTLIVRSNDKNELAQLAKLYTLICARDAFGYAKYKQHLMTGDGRKGLEDAREEMGDLLQYLFKEYLCGTDLSEFEVEVETTYKVMKLVFEMSRKRKE
jgi:hypothetical protein